MGKMEVAELKMVRWALVVTRKDKTRNEYVRGIAKIAKLGEKLRNARLRWYEHVKRREEDYVGKRTIEMAVPGRRKRGRIRRRWMDLVREDMERVGAREGDEVDRVKCRLLSRCGDPESEKPKEEEEDTCCQLQLYCSCANAKLGFSFFFYIVHAKTYRSTYEHSISACHQQLSLWKYCLCSIYCLLFWAAL